MDSPNGLAQDKIISRLRNIIDVVVLEDDLSAMEVIGALEVIKMDIYASLNIEGEDND